MDCAFGKIEKENGSRPRIAVVGNAPRMSDQGAAIDRCDHVIRFNNTAGFGGAAGERVTHLTLVNHGGQMGEWLEEARLLRKPAVRRARRFLFPFPQKRMRPDPANDGARDWTIEAASLLRPLGAPIRILPQAVYEKARAILGDRGGGLPAPSTGFLVALHLLDRARGAEVNIHGFGFEGWSGHDWTGERRWFEAMEVAGRLRLHPLEATSSDPGRA